MKHCIRTWAVALFTAFSLYADGILDHTLIAISAHEQKKKSVKVERLSVGSHVVSFHPQTLEPGDLVNVNHVIRQTVNYVVKISFEDNAHVITSPYQKILIADGRRWVDARQLQPGDRIMLRGHHTRTVHGIKHEHLKRQYEVRVLIMSPGDHILAITPHGILTKQSDKVAELQELFQRKDETFAAALAAGAALTPWKHKSAPIYVVTEDLPEYGLCRGNLLYLDKLHFDHLEVFNAQGTEPVTVLNLDGTENSAKIQIAHAEQRTLVSYLQAALN